MVGSCFACKYKSSLEVNGSGKHSSSLWYGNNYGRKKLLTANNMIFMKVFVTYKMWWQKWSEMLLPGTNWNSSTFLDFLTKKISKSSFVNGRWKTTTTDSVFSFHLNTARSQSWGKCYKTFYVCNLRIFVISKNFFPWQALMFVKEAKSLPK